MGAFARIREYLKGHGAAYTLRRLVQIFRQRYLGTYDRRRALSSQNGGPTSRRQVLAVSLYRYTTPSRTCWKN